MRARAAASKEYIENRYNPGRCLSRRLKLSDNEVLSASIDSHNAEYEERGVNRNEVAVTHSPRSVVGFEK